MLDKVKVPLVLLVIAAALALAAVASAVVWAGSSYNSNAPTVVLNAAQGTATFNRGTSNVTRFQLRLLKNGEQRGSIATLGAPNANTTYQGTVRGPSCLLGTGTWVTQTRGVSTSGSAGPWDTSAGRVLNCG